MASIYDIVIRGGTIMDGNGGSPYIGDVAVKDGRIAAVGTVEGQGAEEINAASLSVTPGFVDIHTHYDGQAMWDSHLAPSSWHGVTTVVMGNCGVGFAPVRKNTQDAVVALMEGVEDLPGPCLNEGLDWSWESFAEYLTALERRKHDIDFCALLPHAPMRVYVMGDRALNLEDANQEDIARMRELTVQYTALRREVLRLFDLPHPRPQDPCRRPAPGSARVRKRAYGDRHGHEGRRRWLHRTDLGLEHP